MKTRKAPNYIEQARRSVSNLLLKAHLQGIEDAIKILNSQPAMQNGHQKLWINGRLACECGKVHKS